MIYTLFSQRLPKLPEQFKHDQKQFRNLMLTPIEPTVHKDLYTVA